ncbi:hypothetical protein HanPI659440_Chr06g0219291 [Helianthus annuus]|nr:hypothetical protein HanPI659440_Chr06g0219291 [Helianthus annuus]
MLATPNICEKSKKNHMHITCSCAFLKSSKLKGRTSALLCKEGNGLFSANAVAFSCIKCIFKIKKKRHVLNSSITAMQFTSRVDINE